MLARFKSKSREFIILFSCGLLFGAIISFLSQSNEIEENTAQSKEETLNSTELFNKVKILCLVLTYEPNHMGKAIHVKNTWGSRCNKLIFASNMTDTVLGSVDLEIDVGYGYLWGRTKRTLTLAYDIFYNDYDWFYKADDDTYALLDNMRFFLSAYSPNDPIYFGKKFNCGKQLGYFSGGSGYVMSKKALKKFVTEGLPDKDKCKQADDGAEDLELGKCMNSIGVYPGDARDRFHRERFLPFYPELHLFPSPSEWYWTSLHYPTDEGLDCCSNSTISIHYIDPHEMYHMEYLLYNLQAYGVRHVYDPMPQMSNFSAIVQELLAENSEKDVCG